MNGWARHLRRLRVVVLAAVTAALLAACSGDPGAAPTAEPTPTDSATPFAEPTPTPTASATPTTDPSQIANNVTYWYESGGEEQIVSVINMAAEIQARHARRAWIIDFSHFFPTVHDAQKYDPIPDRKTQTAWSTALGHLNNGAGDILDSSQLGIVQSQSPEQVKQEARGWKEFGGPQGGRSTAPPHLRPRSADGPLGGPALKGHVKACCRRLWSEHFPCMRGVLIPNARAACKASVPLMRTPGDEALNCSGALLQRTGGDEMNKLLVGDVGRGALPDGSSLP
jgi:hypothetical protein